MTYAATPSSSFDLIYGSGPLARATMKALVAEGRTVRLANRHGTAEGLPAGVEVVRCDASDPTQASACSRGAEVVFQCAQPAYSAAQWETFFPALQRSIAQGARAAGAKLVIGDNLYMYGPVDGPIREDLPYAATSRKGRVRAEMAREIMAMHDSGPLAVAVGRGSDFFGPGVKSSAMGERIFPAILAGKKASLIGNPDVPHTYTFIDDFGHALAVLGHHEAAYGKVWHVPNAPATTTRAFLSEAFRIAGKPASMSTMGRGMLTLGGLFVPAAKEMLELYYEFEKPYVVDSSRFVAAFGDLHTPTAEALRATLDWFREAV
jgi:nucleoside-diphosphate-sugar epimerase